MRLWFAMCQAIAIGQPRRSVSGHASASNMTRGSGFTARLYHQAGIQPGRIAATPHRRIASNRFRFPDDMRPATTRFGVIYAAAHKGNPARIVREIPESRAGAFNPAKTVESVERNRRA